MRLALMIEGQEGVSWEDWLALAEACEEHGVEALFRSDHYLSPTDPEPRGARRLGGHPGARRTDLDDRARHARLARHLPAGGGARERVEDGLRDLGRPRLARHGNGLDGGRARGLWISVSADEGAAADLPGADRGGPPLLGRRPASAPARRRQRPLRHGRARCEVGGRVQHGDGVACGVRGASREARSSVRARGPRADPVLADDRMRDRARRGRGARPDPPPPRTVRPADRPGRVQGEPRRGGDPRDDR